MLYQLSYEATDVGSRSIVGSYVPVKEMSVNDIWSKSYLNCGNEMKMKRRSSQLVTNMLTHLFVPQLFDLEERRKQGMHRLAVLIQKIFRGWRQQKQVCWLNLVEKYGDAPVSY